MLPGLRQCTHAHDTDAVLRGCRKQLEKLRAEAEPILFRAAEVGTRAAAQERADKFVAAARDAIASWPDKKPWIEDKERKAASKQVGGPAQQTLRIYGRSAVTTLGSREQSTSCR